MEREAERFYKKAKNGKLLTIILMIAAFLVFLITMIKADAFGVAFFTYLSAIIAIYLWHFTCERARQCRMLRQPYTVFRDYCVLIEHDAKKTAVKNQWKMLLAKTNICLRRFDLAAQVLNSMNCYELNQDSQAAFYLMWYIIHHVSGNEADAEKNLAVYRQMAQAKRRRPLPYAEKRLAVIASGNEDELLELMNIQENMQDSKKILRHGAGFFTVLSMGLALYAALEQELPAGIFFRTNFIISAYILVAVSILWLFFLCVYQKVQIKRHAGWSITAYVAVHSIILTLGALAVFAYGFLLLLLLPEEKRISDGKILVTYVYFSDPNSYAVYEPYHIVLRRYLYDSDVNGNVLEEDKSKMTEKNTGDDSAESIGNGDDTGTSEQSEQPSQYDEDGVYTGDAGGKEIYEKIYESEFASDYDTISFAYSAKGELYALVGDAYETQVDGETVTAQIRLVYDRESANGACDEVVCYEEHYDASGNRLDNTSILNFYAVTKDTMEVIPADKTSWAERGSQAYCEATGE